MGEAKEGARMNCPNCGRENAENRNYCGDCGLRLTAFCRSCGFRNAVDDRYCGGCGNPQSADIPERKHEPGPELPMEMPALQRAKSPVKEESVYGDKNQLTGAAAAELILASKEAAEVVEEKTELQISQSDIDAMFGG